MIKKELGVYLRVPGSSDQKTDFGRFGYHPSPISGPTCFISSARTVSSSSSLSASKIPPDANEDTFDKIENFELVETSFIWFQRLAPTVRESKGARFWKTRTVLNGVFSMYQVGLQFLVQKSAWRSSKSHIRLQISDSLKWAERNSVTITYSLHFLWFYM